VSNSLSALSGQSSRVFDHRSRVTRRSSL
jgi:hypothetical protein